MTTTRRSALRTAALAMVLAITGFMSTPASASTPPPPPDTTVPAAGATTDPAADPAAQEITESWALTPTGDGSRSELSYDAAPGTVINDSVTLYNLGTVELTFSVYATDAFNNADGDFDLLPGDQVPTEAGSWVTMQAQTVTLPPNKMTDIAFTITVPVDAAPGDHVGAIVASNAITGSNGDGQVLSMDRRTGTRMYIRVGGELSANLGVTDVTTDFHQSANPLGAAADVSFTLQNRGNVRLSGTPVVSVGGPFGLGKKTVRLETFTDLLPGEEMTYTTSLDDVPALMLAFTKITVEPADNADADIASFSGGSDVTFAPSVTLLVLVLALVLLVLARRSYRRRRAAEAAAAEAAAVSQADELEPQLS